MREAEPGGFDAAETGKSRCFCSSNLIERALRRFRSSMSRAIHLDKFSRRASRVLENKGESECEGEEREKAGEEEGKKKKKKKTHQQKQPPNSAPSRGIHRPPTTHDQRICPC